MKRLMIAALASLLAAGAQPLAAQPQCRQERAAAPAVEHLRHLLATARFVAYQPTSLQVMDGRVQEADAESVRADLTVLRTRFDALLTYDAIHGTQRIA